VSVSEISAPARERSTLSLHKLGVFCGLAAAVWLGSAEAPTKLVNAGFSPFIISMGMVMGAFVARWTIPTLLKGTGFLFQDLIEKPHLIVWALLAGMLWAVANTLTIFAVRNVGLAIAFPLWNTNSLVGLFWGWLLFKELRGSGFKGWAKVLGGASAIVGGHHGCARGRCSARHHVYPVSQSVHQRNEPAFIRHHLHVW
jgi:drug/metabolite transporter (DMT)-like permease